jgi:hypothetical protein
MGLPYELAGVASAAVRDCDCTASGADALLCRRVAALELCVVVALDPRHCGASQCGFSTPSQNMQSLRDGRVDGIGAWCGV